MDINKIKIINKITFFLLFSFLLPGCNFLEKMSSIGDTPQLSQIQDPTRLQNYQPVTMPMPSPQIPPSQRSASLWQTGAQAFFKDQRAGKTGDLITVVVSIDQNESIEMTPTLSSQNQNSMSLTNLFGLEKRQFVKNPLSNTNSNRSLSGSGKYKVSDKLNFRISATILQILPNGNMVIYGRQELRLINEVREIVMTGIIRREDITASNTIQWDKISELRVSYGGRGDLSDLQKIPWGQQILNQISPF